MTSQSSEGALDPRLPDVDPPNGPGRSDHAVDLESRGGVFHRSAWLVAFAVSMCVTAAYVAYATWQWNQYVVKSWDLSIFTQLLQSYARLQPPIVNVKGDGFNLLGDHFHPLLAVLTPVFAIFPYAFTMLIIQAACFGISAGMLAATASRHLGTRAGGVLLGLAFGLSWGLQHAAEAQFHEIALAVPLLTGSLLAVIERRWWPAVLWAAPLVFVKEDLGLTVVAVGLLVAAKARKRLGLWLALWGFVWLALATLVILPAHNPNGAWAYAESANPIAVLADPAALFHPSKGETLLLLVAITGGLIIRSPVALILIPTLAWRFLSTNQGYWGPSWHYSAILMPIAFVALLDAIDRGPDSRWIWMRRYTRHGIAIATTVALMLLPQLPLAVLLTPDDSTPPDRAGAAGEILESIPPGSSIESDIGLMNYLVDTHDVYWIGNSNPAPDCIVIDHAAGGTPSEWGDVIAVARRLHPDFDYTTLMQTGDYELACLATPR